MPTLQAVEKISHHANAAPGNGHDPHPPVGLEMLLDQIPVNVILCDPQDLRITYANRATFETLRGMQKLLPIPVDSLVGTSIDVFHRAPERQRAMLRDPRNLPHRATIRLGDEHLDLHVTAITDPNGRYIAAALVWTVATARVRADNEARRLRQMVDQMPINVMSCDPVDFKIDYANQTSLTTLKGLESLLPIKADQLVGQSIDIFHRNPAHQRRLLADPRNLPHSALIKLGPETLSLKVSAIMNPDGSYAGPMLSWSVVTPQFEMANKVKGMVEAVAGAATQLESTAKAMQTHADEGRQQAATVGASAEETSSNVQTVAAAGDELSSSIREIGQQARRASDTAGKAMKEVAHTADSMRGLAEAAEKIGSVVSIINRIAAQTRLLALNATIEAARAGDAGRGFSVVASEVKALADQTATATQEITSQVGGIQAATSHSVQAIEAIRATIGLSSETATAISAAVEQQVAATAEIARNVEQAAQGTRAVSASVAGVSQAATETGAAAGQVLTAAADLAQRAGQMRAEVDQCLDQIARG